MSIAEKLTTIAENEQKVYDAGKQAEHDRHWNYVPYEGFLISIFSGPAWNDETFRPRPGVIKPTYCGNMFTRCFITDLKGRLEECGTTIDFSKATTIGPLVEGSTITRLPEIDTRSCSTLGNFLYNSNLVSVDKIIMKEEGNQHISTLGFKLSKSLTHCIFEGKLGSCSLDFSDCPLNIESLKSIISCLRDYSGTTKEFKYTLTLSSGCWEALENDSSSPIGGTWADYVESLGWLT